MGRLVNRRIMLPYSRKYRILRIYLPENYDRYPHMRFPVLYMFDGQNLYEDELAYGGVSWGIKEAMEWAEDEGITEGCIVVGIENGGDDRMSDYSPWDFDEWTNETTEIKGDKFADFMACKLKKFIDRHYRTYPEREMTAVAGSSAGANIASYLMAVYPEIYGYGGIFSLATWLFEEPFRQTLWDHPPIAQQRFFIQVGTQEGFGEESETLSQTYIDTSVQYSQDLVRMGHNVDDIRLNITAGHAHNEWCWRESFPEFLYYLFDRLIDGQ